MWLWNAFHSSAVKLFTARLGMMTTYSIVIEDRLGTQLAIGVVSFATDCLCW